jgi:hypothetical protein
MSEPDEQARLDRLIDQAVEEFLLLPDDRVLDRVKELTGKKDSVALDFDRLMTPVLSKHKHQLNQDLRIQSAASRTSTWRRFLAWDPADNLTRTFFSRPIRSALASLVVVIAGATLIFPLWRIAPGPDSSSIDSDQSHIPRSVPKDLPGQRPVRSSTAGDSVYMAQLTKSFSFSRAAEALDRINAKYPSQFRDQSLMVRRADSGEDPGAYIGGVGGLKSERDAEQICSKVRAGGDPCNVVKVPNE